MTTRFYNTQQEFLYAVEDNIQPQVGSYIAVYDFLGDGETQIFYVKRVDVSLFKWAREFVKEGEELNADLNIEVYLEYDRNG